MSRSEPPSLFEQKWRLTASDLGLEIECPHTIALPSGEQLVVPVLVRNFGHTIGMALVTDFDEIARHADAIVEAGYGFSTLSQPRSLDEYDRETAIQMLRDWGWSGAEADRPNWL